MHVTRRNLAVAGVLALGTSSLLHSTAVVAESSDEAAVNQAVEALRKALLAADKARLQQLGADQLSYGHSDGRVQTKAEFIDGVMTHQDWRPPGLAKTGRKLEAAGTARVQAGLTIADVARRGARRLARRRHKGVT